jgi:hypothetical protein
MTGGTKGGAQSSRTLKAYVRRGGSLVTATPIYHLNICSCSVLVVVCVLIVDVALKQNCTIFQMLVENGGPNVHI